MMKISTDKHTLNWLRRIDLKGMNTSLSTDSKSNIIYSILAGIPIPICILSETEPHDIFAGEDYISSIIDFIHGNFPLSKNPDFEKEIGMNLEGKTFFDFSDDEKESFMDIDIFIGFGNLTERQRLLIKDNFALYRAISLVEGNEPPASLIDSHLEDMLKHKFFESVNVPVPTIDLVVQCLMLDENGITTDMKNKDISAFKENLSKESCKMEKELDYLLKAYPEKTTYLKKTHIPMIFIVGKKALKDKVDPKTFRTILDNFYSDVTSEYKKACDSGTSSKSNVNKRLKILMSHFLKSSK